MRSVLALLAVVFLSAGAFAAQANETPIPEQATPPLWIVEKDGKTSLTQTMRYESREARDAVLKSPMEEGVGVSYDRLAEVLTTLA